MLKWLYVHRPSAGRVSGVVEENPGTLEYEVALFREMNGRTTNHLEPVSQAVPIGDRLELRARINTDSRKEKLLILQN